MYESWYFTAGTGVSRDIVILGLVSMLIVVSASVLTNIGSSVSPHTKINASMSFRITSNFSAARLV